MTIAVRAPVPMLRRGLASVGGVVIAAVPEDGVAQQSEGLSARERAVAEGRRGDEEGARSTEADRDGAEVAGLGRQGGGRRISSSLSPVESRRERLARRLRAVQWRGAVTDSSREAGEATAMTDAGTGQVETTRGRESPQSGIALRAETGLRVAAPQVSSGGGLAERATGGTATYPELRVRERERGAEVVGPRMAAVKRQRRVEIEAEEDLRLELVR